MIFEEKFKDFKSLYLTVSGGSDSAIGLYLTCKYITENNLNSKVTIVTAVEPQTDYCPNFMNAKKVVSIVRDIFPKVNIDKHIIKFLEGYGRPSEEEIINGPLYVNPQGSFTQFYNYHKLLFHNDNKNHKNISLNNAEEIRVMIIGILLLLKYIILNNKKVY